MTVFERKTDNYTCFDDGSEWLAMEGAVLSILTEQLLAAYHSW